MYFGQSDDVGLAVTVSEGGSKAEEGCIDGAAKRRGYQKGYLVVIGKGVAESDALLFTKRRQQRVMHLVVFGGQVVEALDEGAD